MRIGIDAYPLSRKFFTGISNYLYNIIEQLKKVDKENEYFLYGCGNSVVLFQNSRWHIYQRKIPTLIKKFSTFWLLWGIWYLRKSARHDKIDIFWGTHNFLPIFLPKSIKKVITIHDVVLYVCPQTLSFIVYLVYKMLFKRSLFSADKIITNSITTKDILKKYFPELEDEKIVTIYCGGRREIFQPHDKNDSREYISKKFNISHKYILTAVSLEWRKNVAGLLKAYYLCKNKFNIEHKLLIVGGERRSNEKVIYKIYKQLSLEDNVYFLGYVDIKDLIYFYSAADAFVFPSFYEGFGFPPLEAMACGTPVVASDISVFREILGEAAFLVDPYRPEKIAEGIYKVLTDKILADELRKKGFERVKLFSWEKAAKETLKIFNQLK